jgi:hypothetical protein
VQARVARAIDAGRYGLTIAPDEGQRENLIFKVYCTDNYIVAPTQWSFLRCLRQVLRQVFSIRRLTAPRTATPMLPLADSRSSG